MFNIIIELLFGVNMSFDVCLSFVDVIGLIVQRILPKLTFLNWFATLSANDLRVISLV